VLIGEDSLEANVGHLAALTGGEIFIASGHDIAPAFAAALRALRQKGQPIIQAQDPAGRLLAGRAGMRLIASFEAAAVPADHSIAVRAVAALAASLRLPTLGTAEAAQLAEAEGLVTHLTSLVLVDEHGATQETIPASRKVPLATPATAGLAAGRASIPREMGYFASSPASAPVAACAPPAGVLACEAPTRSREIEQAMRREEQQSLRRSEARGRFSPAAEPKLLRRLSSGVTDWFRRDMLERSGEDLSRIAQNMNWDFAPDRLQAGDLKGLGSSVQEAIRKAAAKSDVIALASMLGLPPVVLVIGLMAHAVAQKNRSARRLASVLLPATAADEQKAVARGLGLG
jgi:hypothetical protein